MNDAGTGKVKPRKTLHALPSPTTTTSLAATAEHMKPKTSYFVDETTEAAAIARDGMIVQPTSYNALQPTGRFSKWPVGHTAKLGRAFAVSL